MTGCESTGVSSIDAPEETSRILVDETLEHDVGVAGLAAEIL